VKRPEKWILAALLCGYVAAMIGCEGGTSSETVGIVEETAGQNGITGRTDPGNKLGLYSADFLPHLDQGFAMTATADSTGAFSFANLPPGRYQLLARNPGDGKAALLVDIAVPADTNANGRARLEPTGTLSGTITASARAFLGIAYVPGTPFFAPADSLMQYVIKDMPAGAYEIVKTWKMISCAPGATCAGPDSLADSALVRIRPGESAVW